ncbi:MAG: hypothetical protein ABIS86_07025 [Streptosporangiaceae bacterium]
MTAKTRKETAAEDQTEEEEYETSYEDDLLDLVERLAKRRSQTARGPARPRTAETAKTADPIDTADTAELLEEDKEDDQDAEPEVDAERTETRQPAHRRVRILTIVSAVLTLVLAVVGTFAVVQARGYADSRSTQEVRQKVAQRAGQIVSVLFTYDYHDAKGYLEKQAAVMTRSAAATVKPNWATLTTLFETGKYVSTAQIEQVYVGDISGNKASVIVVVNNKLTTSKGIQSSAGASLRFGLLKEDGVWLANAIPELQSTGVQTNTDLEGKPLTAPVPTPSPTK